MKIKQVSPLKLVAAALMLFYSLKSFSQNDHFVYPQYGDRPTANYFPRAHDSATTVMPKLTKKNFIYYGFLSSLNQHVSFEYDRQMSDEVMLCGQIGIINSGVSQVTSGATATGGYFEAGVKLFFNPDYTKSGPNKYYVVEGLYLKPQVVLTIFNTVSTSYPTYYVYPPATVTNDYSYTGGAITVCLGGQWIIARTIVIDLYGGVGVSFSNAYSANNPIIYNYYNYLSTGENIPIAFTGGINIGLPLK